MIAHTKVTTVEAGLPGKGSVWEVFFAFLRLGLTSFGGPIAHFGFFHRELIEYRRWISEAAYVDLVALCQLLPGPARSQVAFALGYLRAGIIGAICRDYCFCGAVRDLDDPDCISFSKFSLWHVAWFKARCCDCRCSGCLVDGNAILYRSHPFESCHCLGLRILLASSAWLQAVLILLGGLFRYVQNSFVSRQCAKTQNGVADTIAPANSAMVIQGELSKRSLARFCLALFFVLLLLLPIAAHHTEGKLLHLADGFYRSGALVFGGGHTVLPLLKAVTVENDFVDQNTFMDGYRAEQAMPGPLFTFAA